MARYCLTFVALVLGVVIAAQDSAQAQNKYGAIAFSVASGAHGYSYDFPTRGAAERRALLECRKRGGGCKVVIWFRNACGALAVGAGNGWGSGWASTKNKARRVAMGYCRQHTTNCHIARWVCTRR